MFCHYGLSMSMPNMKLIGEFITQLETPQAIDAKNHKILVIWDLNGYGEYEFDLCICDKVMACTSVGVRRRRRRRRNQKHNTPTIFKFRGYNNLSKRLDNSSMSFEVCGFESVIFRCR